jgi:mannose-6-phosphate isomerase-like protein (cupin superfamily)
MVKVLSWDDEDLRFEADYNVLGKRLFPWQGVTDPDWFGAWVVLPPGEVSTPHSHGENEVFFIVSGRGEMRVGDEHRRVGFGDTVFIDSGHEHELTNDGDESIVYLSIWWQPNETKSAQPVAR